MDWLSYRYFGNSVSPQEVRERKQVMKGQKTLSTIKLLLVGIAIGFASTILFGLVLYCIEGDELSMDPKTFGNIKVWVQETPSAEDTMALDVSKMMFMAKADVPFLSVRMDKDGQVAHLSLLNEKGRVCLTMMASTGPDKWERVIYAGGDGNGNYTVGEMFVNINFNGHFDAKHVFDDTGKKVARYIYIGHIWKQVNRCNDRKAALGQTKYTFDPNSGWRKE